MRTQWTTKGNQDASSSCSCDRGLHRYLRNFGGFEHPKPPLGTPLLVVMFQTAGVTWQRAPIGTRESRCWTGPVVCVVFIVMSCAGDQIPQTRAHHLQGGEWPQLWGVNPWKLGCSIPSPWCTWNGTASLPRTSEHSPWAQGRCRRGVCSPEPWKLFVFAWWIWPGGSFLWELSDAISGTKWQSHVLNVAREFVTSMRVQGVCVGTSCRWNWQVQVAQVCLMTEMYRTDESEMHWQQQTFSCG